MQENKIEPTLSEFDKNVPGSPAVMDPSVKGEWFNSRPIPVYIIACWCILKWTHRSRQYFSEFKLCPFPMLQLVGAAP
jgi:hypothetical protein